MSDALNSPVATAMAETLIHFLWQGLLISVGYWIAQEAIGLRSAYSRYLAALTALVIMTISPMVTFLVVYETHESNQVGLEYHFASVHQSEEVFEPVSKNADAVENADAPKIRQRVEANPSRESAGSIGLSFALMLWLAGVLLSGMRLLAGYFNVAWLHWGRVEINADLARHSRRLAERIGLSAARVYASDRIREAAVVGFLRPTVLVPTSWLVALPTAVLEAVIAHELAHIRRHDVWINLFQRIVETLLFYHPAIWWLSGRIRMERELCCDELAIQATGQRKNYALALEQVGRLQLNGTYRLAPSFRGDRKMNLLRRVKNVLQVGQPHREPAWLIGVVAVALPVAFLCVVGGFGETNFEAVAQEREGGRSAEADAGPRRSPEADAGPRRSPEAEAGPRRSAEGDRGPRRSAEGGDRDQVGDALRGFRPQTPREAALLQMIQQLQRDMAQLRREVRGGSDRERPVSRDRAPDVATDEEFELARNWQRTKEGRVFKAYDKNGDGVVVLEEWLAMTNGNINDARRALQTKRFQDAEPSGDDKFMPAEFIWWYKIGRNQAVEGSRRDRGGEGAQRGDRDGDERGRSDREVGRRDYEDDKSDKRGSRDGDTEKRGPRDGDRAKEGPRDGEKRKDSPRDGDRE